MCCEKINNGTDGGLKLQDLLPYLVKTSASGDEIILTDSVDSTLQDFCVYGKTEQFTTTGSNLFDIDSFLELPIEENPSTKEGVRILIMTLKPNTKYVISTDAEGSCQSSDVKNSRSLYCSTVQDTTYQCGTTGVLKGKPIAFTTGADGRIKIVLFDRPHAEVFYNRKAYIMLNEGTSALPYEPYTGGKTSPSPAYPQEIVNAGRYNEETGKYEVDVILTGKNLFDMNKNVVSAGYNGFSNIINIPKTGNYRVYNDKDSPGECYFVDITHEETGLYHPYVRLWRGYGHFPVKFRKGESKLGFNNTLQGGVVDIGNELIIITYENATDYKSYEPYKEPQIVTITSGRPITKWDKLEKRDGVWGWVYSSDIKTFENAEVTLYAELENTIQYQTKFEPIKRSYDTSIVVCNTFSNAKGSDIYTQSSENDYFVGELKGNIVFSAKEKGGIFESVESFQKWLRTSETKIIHKIDTEEFVPLREEEQVMLSGLKTYYPTTVILNSEDTNMEIHYIADTKNYIDNKINEQKKSNAKLSGTLEKVQEYVIEVSSEQTRR